MPQVLVEQVYSVDVITEVSTGLQGPAGASGTQILTIEAGESVGGHRVVYQAGTLAMHANENSLNEAEAVIGISISAASPGVSLQVQRAGIIMEPTWSWSPGPVYLAGTGLMTQEAPSAGVLLQVGIALSPTQLDVRIGAPIELL